MTISAEQPLGRPEVMVIGGSGPRPGITLYAYALSVVGVEAVTARHKSDLLVQARRDGNGDTATVVVFENGRHTRALIVPKLDAPEGNYAANLVHPPGRMLPCLAAVTPGLRAFHHEEFPKPPYLNVVVGWKAGRFSDLTYRYPATALSAAAEYRSDMFTYDWPHRSRYWFDWAMLGYYANMVRVGRREEAERWIRHHAPAVERQWFMHCRSDMWRVATAPQFTVTGARCIHVFGKRFYPW